MSDGEDIKNLVRCTKEHELGGSHSPQKSFIRELQGWRWASEMISIFLVGLFRWEIGINDSLLVSQESIKKDKPFKQRF